MTDWRPPAGVSFKVLCIQTLPLVEMKSSPCHWLMSLSSPSPDNHLLEKAELLANFSEKLKSEEVASTPNLDSW